MSLFRGVWQGAILTPWSFVYKLVYDMWSASAIHPGMILFQRKVHFDDVQNDTSSIHCGQIIFSFMVKFTAYLIWELDPGIRLLGYLPFWDSYDGNVSEI